MILMLMYICNFAQENKIPQAFATLSKCITDLEKSFREIHNIVIKNLHQNPFDL